MQVGGWQQSERDSLSTCQPAAAGVQVCTPTHLLHLSLGWRIAPLPCPPAANSPMLRRPQPPRAFRVPLWHSDTVDQPLHFRTYLLCELSDVPPMLRLSVSNMGIADKKLRFEFAIFYAVSFRLHQGG